MKAILIVLAVVLTVVGQARTAEPACTCAAAFDSVVAGPERPLIKVITVYQPDEKRWIDHRYRRNPNG